jgi:predicted nuclease of predicted toxin-antitoxin system
MKIKLDENLPVSLVATLSSLSHDVHTVAEENLSGSSDREVWKAAQSDQRFLITQDFGLLRPATLRSRNASRHPTRPAPLAGPSKPNPPRP